MLNHVTLRADTAALLSRLGVELPPPAGPAAGAELTARSPITGGELGRVAAGDGTRSRRSWRGRRKRS
jgi:hypothetical protein